MQLFNFYFHSPQYCSTEALSGITTVSHIVLKLGRESSMKKRGLSGSWVEYLALELFSDFSLAYRGGWSESFLEAFFGHPIAHSMLARL